MALNSMRSLHNTIKLVSCEQKTLQGKFSRLEDQKHFSFSVSRSSLPSFLCHFVPFFKTALPVLPFILPLFHPLFGLPVELFSMKKEKKIKLVDCKKVTLLSYFIDARTGLCLSTHFVSQLHFSILHKYLQAVVGGCVSSDVHILSKDVLKIRQRCVVFQEQSLLR